MSSRIHFVVHPSLGEIRAYAEGQGWRTRGFTQLRITWQELVYTVDGWATVCSLKSTEVPSPVVDGYFLLKGVPKGTSVDFAIHVGVSCHAPGDAAGYRERGDLWLNNGGLNFTQLSQ